MEELAAAAVKEEAIEAKLAALAAQWAVLSLTFQDYKTRGPVILKARPRGAAPRRSRPAHAPRACMHALLLQADYDNRTSHAWKRWGWAACRATCVRAACSRARRRR